MAKAALAAYLEQAGRGAGEDVPIAQMTTGRVRLVIDEVGDDANFVRAVLRSGDAVRSALRESLKVDPAVGINVFVGGTGSASPDVPFGSEPGKYHVWDMLCGPPPGPSDEAR